jgi:hypothetical protein
MTVVVVVDTVVHGVVDEVVGAVRTGNSKDNIPDKQGNYIWDDDDDADSAVALEILEHSYLLSKQQQYLRLHRNVQRYDGELLLILLLLQRFCLLLQLAVKTYLVVPLMEQMMLSMMHLS